MYVDEDIPNVLRGNLLIFVNVYYINIGSEYSNVHKPHNSDFVEKNLRNEWKRNWGI